MKIEQLIKENDEQKKKYNLEIENIINERDFQQINFNKRMTIFDQKLNKVHDIEMENEVYKDELNTLKDKNKKLEESVNLKKTELQINNKIKFNQIKNKVINDLKETKKNMLSLNLENMDIKSQIIFFQNNKLLEQIEYQKKEMDSIIKQNKELKLRIINLEKEIDIKDKVQFNLANKLNHKNKKSLNLFNRSSLFNKYNKESLFLNNNYINNKNEENFIKSNILNTSSTNFEQSINNKKAKTKSKNKINKIKNINLNNIDLLLNNTNHSSNSKIDNDNNNRTFKSEKNDKTYDYEAFPNEKNGLRFYSLKQNRRSIKNNDNNENSLIKISHKREIYQKKDNYFFHKKQNQIINNKNYEIENLKITIDNLKNKLSFNAKKYKKIYNFLENCLNNFFSDILLKEKNISLNIEEIKKFNFEIFNKEEKYSLLVLLMNHLLPLILYNFKSDYNIGNNIFKTNINIQDKTFNKRIDYINDNTLRKAFIGKNNKLQKELYLKNITFSNGSIPVLRKNDISN